MDVVPRIVVDVGPVAAVGATHRSGTRTDARAGTAPAAASANTTGVCALGSNTSVTTRATGTAGAPGTTRAARAALNDVSHEV